MLGLEQIHVERMTGALVPDGGCVCKDREFTELAVKPVDHGHKRKEMDLRQAEEYIDEGNDARLAVGAVSQYRRRATAHAHHQRGKRLQTNRDVPEVRVISGPAGTATRRWLEEQFGLDGWFEVPDHTGKWFDGCDTSDVLVFRDVGLGRVPRLDLFLKLTDRYGFHAPVRGAFIWLKPRVIVFISTSSPYTWWKNLSESAKGQVKRRITYSDTSLDM